MIEDATTLYNEIEGRLDVKANKTWNRVSIRNGESLYFVKRGDGRFIIHLNGNNISRFGDFAVYHWGNARSVYQRPNKRHEITWLIDFDILSKTVVAVMNKQYELPNDSILEKKIDDIYNNPDLSTYEKSVLAKVRVGHSKFAKEVKKKFGFNCAVKPHLKRNLIAAHIKPWSTCKDIEKTDLYNGICLSPDIDGLFENGDISFNDYGAILIKDDLTKLELQSYGLSGNEKIKIDSEYSKYLNWHRKNKFKC